VNKELSTPIGLSASRTALPAGLRILGTVVAGSIFLAVCAHVSIPLWFTPVPLSLQPFGVLLIGLLLAPRLAAATLLAYLAEGAVGLPVFAPGLAGIAHLLGPTGGYLMAYPAAAFLISCLRQNGPQRFAVSLAAAALGDLLILACGTLWLASRTHTSLTTAASLAALPFLPGDALKVSAASGLSAGWRRIRRQTN
jgi:biotin transport system substrate-specific component